MYDDPQKARGWETNVGGPRPSFVAESRCNHCLLECLCFYLLLFNLKWWCIQSSLTFNSPISSIVRGGVSEMEIGKWETRECLVLCSTPHKLALTSPKQVFLFSEKSSIIAHLKPVNSLPSESASLGWRWVRLYSALDSRRLCASFLPSLLSDLVFSLTSLNPLLYVFPRRRQ